MSFHRIPVPPGEWRSETLVPRARAALSGSTSTLTIENAIELLASSAFPNRHRDLERILLDRDAPSRVRMRAAMALGRCGRDAASEILVTALGIDDAVVRLGVMRALGMVGGSEALKAIDDVMPELSGRVRDQAMFARTLIAHRLGETVAETRDTNGRKPLEPAPDCGRRVLIRRTSPGTVEQCLTSIGGRSYGIEVDERSVMEYRCDRSTGAILMNRAFAGRDAVERLLARPALVGLEARKDKASGRYSVASLILTTPRGDGIDIRVHLTNGTLIFTGRAEARGGEAHWNLHAIHRAGAFPFRALGRFAGGQLVIEAAESGARVVQQLRPKVIDVGALGESGNGRV